MGQLAHPLRLTHHRGRRIHCRPISGTAGDDKDHGRYDPQRKMISGAAFIEGLIFWGFGFPH
jgi:hypothetical protein